MISIRYRGAIEIDDKTSGEFFINTAPNFINIMPIQKVTGGLNNLFEYVGEFKILQTSVVTLNGEKTEAFVKQVLDYSELINTKSEDLTRVSEYIRTNRTKGKKIAKTILKQPFVENLMTTDRMNLVDEDGEGYSGYYHVDLISGHMMSGGVNSTDSHILRSAQDRGVRKATVGLQKKRQRKHTSQKAFPENLFKRLISEKKMK